VGRTKKFEGTASERPPVATGLSANTTIPVCWHDYRTTSYS